MKTSAIYAASFDPPTNGHLWVIEEAVKLFSDLRIVIGINPKKEPMFSLTERIWMLKEMTKHLGSAITIQTMYDRFLVDFGPKMNINHIVRGIRSASDYEYEKQMNDINRKINKNVTAWYVIPPPEIASTSSSTVKSLIGPAGWELELTKYVPDSCLLYIMKKGSTLYKRLQEMGLRSTSERKELYFWKTLISAYTNPGRQYHNFKHIARTLKDFHEHGFLNTYQPKPRPMVEMEFPIAMELAIWFHDVHYVPNDPLNEQKSADIAANWLFGLPKNVIARVKELILATRHTVPIDPADKEAAFIIDLDLSILGKDEDIFDEYDSGIRHEFSKFSDLTYARGRIDFLNTILARERIFTHDYFFREYEEKARANITRTIDRLERSLL